MCIVLKKISIGVGDIHPDGQISDVLTRVHSWGDSPEYIYTCGVRLHLWGEFGVFKNFVNLSNKNGNKFAIFNLILTKLDRIHGRIVVNACVKYLKRILVCVGDIHPGRQNFQIFCQFEQTKMTKSAIMNFVWTKLHRIH